MSPSVAVLEPRALARDLAVPDLTATPGHALAQLVDAAVGALAADWQAEVRVIRTHPVVSLEDNYDRLGFPPDAVTRDARYSRYVSETCLLRTHTSAVVPPALRALAAEGAARPPDVLLACPGVVYRRDVIDRLHTGTPHQLDLWRVTDRTLTTDDLRRMIALVVDAVLPGRRWRTVDAVHPYTEHGLQVDVEADDGEWVEIGECGMAGPAVLAGAGLPVPPTTGLAMGLGVDRLVLLRKGIPDIRLLRSADPRIAGQLLDLEPYRPVSNHPPVRRDLSVALDPADADEELLGDLVRGALGDEADAVEAVSVLDVTPGEALPPAARERIGLRPGQCNVLLRVVLRPVDRTLTDAEANALRDRIYAAVHQGAAHQWTTVPA